MCVRSGEGRREKRRGEGGEGFVDGGWQVWVLVWDDEWGRVGQPLPANLWAYGREGIGVEKRDEGWRSSDEGWRIGMKGG